MELVFVVISILSTLSHVFAVKPKEVCLLQLDEGPCRGDVERFYYNTITQKCEEFSYGGCAGNSNNFLTFQECQKSCWKIPKTPQICRFPKEEGPCRGFFQRYFFNMTTMQCQPFYYGGCQGNNNRFDDAQSCMEYCRPRKTTPVMCLDRLDVGQCSASIPRYHYNLLTKTCEQFLYSGCGRSSNNFVSKKSCMDICVPSEYLTLDPVLCPHCCRSQSMHVYGHTLSHTCCRSKHLHSWDLLSERWISCHDYNSVGVFSEGSLAMVPLRHL